MKAITVAWGLVRDPATMQTQATVAHRQSIVDVADRAGGTRPVTQSPYRFSAAKSGVRGPAPHKGEHNRQVLQELLSLSDTQLMDLEKTEILIP